MIKNRKGEIIVTNENQNRLLGKLYGSAAGRCALKVLTAPAVSKTVGAFMDSSASKPLIGHFVNSCGIDTSQYIMSGINSYNDFFTRRIKSGRRPVDLNPRHLISPCDSKLTAYEIGSGSCFRIKDSFYSVADLVGSERLAERYTGGLCLIFRLEVDDYHRYCYIDSGVKSKNVFIPGELHTVNPIALEHYNIYKRNSREATVMYTENFGAVTQVEVGAMLVGRIENYHGKGYRFTKGEEKGKFLFGGSTIVLLIGKGCVQIDSDILGNSDEGYETVVKYGERIGSLPKPVTTSSSAGK